MTYKTIAEPLVLNLQLFAEGNSAGEGGTGTEGNATAESGFATARKGRNSNPLANVKYGIQEEAEEGLANPDEGGDGNAAEEDDKPQEKLFSQSEVEEIVKKRLKNSKESEEKLAKLSNAISILSERYEIEDGDYDSLVSAIENDDSFYEDAAMESGMDVKELKKIKQMERNNKRLTQQVDELQRKEFANRQLQTWMQQAEQLKKTFPSFDFKQEAQNPKFLEQLEAGTDVETAFKLLHLDDIISGAMQYTAKTVEKKLANKQKANNRMPIFNGSQNKSGSVTKTDVSQLTKADRQEIIRRVQRGEKIRF